MRPGAGELAPDPITERLDGSVTGPHCQGYATGCQCPRCRDRAHGIATGELYYDERGQLRWREDPTLSPDYVLDVYRRSLAPAERAQPRRP